ncbi:MAG TPA: OB-fold nucleic acid binding domain-containing protein, partial [Dehalococcoidia bacterium]|nr:OB-fold nucleic acid binding domain-containing protein [Dehalococcoidia bacterium]
RRVDLRAINKRVLESLIKCGAADSLGQREALLQGLDRLVALAQQHQRLKDMGQSTMFDLWGQEVPVPLGDLGLPQAPASNRHRLIWEKELTGVYFTDHPFGQAARLLAQATTTFCGQITPELEGQTVTVAGMVVSARRLHTRDGKPFVAAVLEDLDGTVEVTAWPEAYQRTQDLWLEGAILLVRGKVKSRDDGAQVICHVAQAYNAETGEAPAGEQERNGGTTALKGAAPKRLHIVLARTHDQDLDMQRLREVFAIIQSFPGNDAVTISLSNGGEIVQLDLPSLFTECCPALCRALEGLVGQESLSVQ